MISVNIDTSEVDKSLDLYQQALQKAPGVMATLTRRRVQRSTSRILQKLTVEPESTPDHPFIWSYNPEKQARARRWYFANVVRGNVGGRYTRTHKTAKAWRVVVEIDESGGTISAANNAAGVDYVEGDRQVPSHYNTGWLTPVEIDDILLNEAILLEDQLFQDWQTAADPFAGVR